jgi:hypothetical protein
MWLPIPFYQRAPHYWLLLGLLLIIIGIYLGLEVQRLYLYIGVGIGMACCLWSLRIFMRRTPGRPPLDYDEYLDQTCELNHKPEQP